MTTEKTKEKFLEVCLRDRGTDTEIFVYPQIPTFIRSFVVQSCMWSCIFVGFFLCVCFIWLPLVNVNLLLTFGPDASDRSVWELAALRLSSVFVDYFFLCSLFTSVMLTLCESLFMEGFINFLLALAFSKNNGKIISYWKGTYHNIVVV